MEMKILTFSFKSLNFIKFDGSEITYEELVNACETLPFMDAKKIILINNCTFFKSKKGKKEDYEEEQPDSLSDYIPNMPDTTILIFITNEEIDKRKKLFKCVSKYGSIVEFGSLKGEELIKWIKNEFEKQNKIIDKKDAVYFAEKIPGNLNDILNEINKLCAYTGNEKIIKRSDIDNVVSKSLEMNIFQLVHHVSTGNTDQALFILNELILESEPIPLILTMIIRQFRLLLNIKLLLKKGYSNNEITDKLGLKPFAFNNLLKISSSISESKILERLNRCIEFDSSIKKGKIDQRTALELLIVEFAK